MLLYVKNLTLREIGEILGVSESRVCQIHSQLKRKLRDRSGRRRCCSQKSPSSRFALGSGLAALTGRAVGPADRGFAPADRACGPAARRFAPAVACGLRARALAAA